MNDSDKEKLDNIRKLAAKQRMEQIKERAALSRNEKKERAISSVKQDLYGALARIMIITGIALAIGSVIIYTPKTTPDIQPTVEARVLTRGEKIKKQFNYQGDHKVLRYYIKRYMKDPSSYQWVQTTHADHGSYLIVLTIYRGKNAFGAYVLDRTKAKVDPETGDILEIIE